MAWTVANIDDHAYPLRRNRCSQEKAPPHLRGCDGAPEELAMERANHNAIRQGDNGRLMATKGVVPRHVLSVQFGGYQDAPFARQRLSV